MAENNGANQVTADDSTATHDAPSLNGYGAAAPEPPFTDRPEILVGAAVLGGVLLAGVVSRLGR